MTAALVAVAKQFGAVGRSVRRWLGQAAVDAGERVGVSSAELEEVKRLKLESHRLREDVEILRGTTTFFVGELDPRNR